MATGGTDDVHEFTELAAEIEQTEREAEVRKHSFVLCKLDFEKGTNGNGKVKRTPPPHESSRKERVAKSAVGSNVPSERVASAFRKPIILPDVFHAQGKWKDYLNQFLPCADINGWSNVEKARFLGARLKGQAQEVYVDLSLSDIQDFGVIVRALNQHFQPDASISVRKTALKNRVAAEGESLTLLCSSIRRDVIDAYPNVNRQAQDELSMD
ncbi:hypothetical protein BSL78_29074 [Apostichopus japonicus]|uniref:Uncharacterized protein n=1 Tax=Stichopus japonicus TaxID=307972 RepID=A0A2G8JED0_STIJA|nr:hypothetical protein BSL78_29074 [Apostichopus japonicus]